MGFKVGTGGRIGPFRAGISNRGIGVGGGPFVTGTSFRYRKQQASGSGAGSWIASILIFVMLVGLVLFWPYLLGTYVAVSLLSAGMHSTLRSIIGWIPESIWLGFLVFQIAKYVASRYFNTDLIQVLYKTRERFMARSRPGR